MYVINKGNIRLNRVKAIDGHDFLEDEYLHAYDLNGGPLICSKHKEGMFNAGGKVFCQSCGPPL